MEEKLVQNSYISIALNDLYYLSDSCNGNYYNNYAVGAQQIVEKLLKGYVELFCSEKIAVSEIKILLQQHNLRRLGECLNKNLGLKIDLKDMSYLKDFYYEARYPGDNFVLVDRENCIECFKIMNRVIEILKVYDGTLIEFGYDAAKNKTTSFGDDINKCTCF